MAMPKQREPLPAEAVNAYKRILAEVIDRRPSGTRQRLAAALAKNRSFVSQITNPAYNTPIPSAHLTTIFEVCHFSKPEQRAFLDFYAIAHPRRVPASIEATARSVALPDLGDDSRNARLHAMVSEFVSQLASLLDEQNGRGKRK